MKKYTIQEFIEKAQIIHNYKYDYSKVNYKNSYTKICIICPIHGEFWQNPSNHLYKNGCSECTNCKKSNTEEFIEKAKLIHGNKYDYSKSIYINNRTKVCITCPSHGEFWQTPINHINRKNGCFRCIRKIVDFKSFIDKVNKVHNYKYNYSKVNYKNSQTKVCIICPSHNEFWQTPNNHISQKQGCPKCNESRGEKIIETCLLENEVKFEREKKFNDCKNKRSLPFDFYLPNYNLLIEYDGEQHYVGWYNNKKGLKQIQHNDNIKNNYCKKNNIKLLRIPYTEFNDIKKILFTYIFPTKV